MKLTVTYRFYNHSVGNVASTYAKKHKQFLETKKLAQIIRKKVKNTLLEQNQTLATQYSENAIRNYRKHYLIGKLRKEYNLEFAHRGKTFYINASNLLAVKEGRRRLIQEIRRDAKQVRSQIRENQTRSHGYVCRELVGGVHTKPGFFSTLYRRRLAKMVFEPKRPMTNEHHIGIELEFTAAANRDALGTALFEAGVAPFVTLKGDGSIRVEKQNHCAHELAICVPQSKLEEVIGVVTKVLAAHSASVNKSTGMHTHIDVRNRDRRKAFSRLVAAQGILYAMQPKSRRDNSYCKRTKSRDLDTAWGAGRYQGVNPQAVNKYSTIEVRLHAGTVSFDKIVNWTKLLIAIVDGDYIEPTRAPRKLETFCDAYKIGGELRAYIKSRMDKFGSTEAIEEVESA